MHRGTIRTVALAQRPAVAAAPRHPDPVTRQLRSHVESRRLRGRHFDASLFRDYAWAILLDIAVAERDGRVLRWSAACVAGGASHGTGDRMLRLLVDRGLVVRIPSKADRRVVHVLLSYAGRTAMTGWLEATRGQAAPAPGARRHPAVLDAVAGHLRAASALLAEVAR